MFNTCFQFTPLLHTTANADVYYSGALNLVYMHGVENPAVYVYMHAYTYI